MSMIDQQKAKEAYEAFVQRAADDDRVLGVILAGGRGKGAHTQHSDYDVMLITTDEGLEGVVRDYPKTTYIDSLPHALSVFREHAKTGTRTAYNKYTFTHNVAVIDKTGEIQSLIDAKGVLEPDKVYDVVRNALGGYFNSLHRSLKNSRDGNRLAGLLDAVETISRILTFLFALESRVRPFNKFLTWELEQHPLQKLPMNAVDLLADIEKIVTTGDVTTQKKLLQVIRTLAAENGHADEVAQWEGYYFG